ncbi:MAG: hypothetical protein GY754_45810 [bacterium]|nr:hypothetical protein [bacterium]
MIDTGKLNSLPDGEVVVYIKEEAYDGYDIYDKVVLYLRDNDPAPELAIELIILLLSAFDSIERDWDEHGMSNIYANFGRDCDLESDIAGWYGKIREYRKQQSQPIETSRVTVKSNPPLELFFEDKSYGITPCVDIELPKGFVTVHLRGEAGDFRCVIGVPHKTPWREYNDLVPGCSEKHYFDLRTRPQSEPSELVQKLMDKTGADRERCETALDMADNDFDPAVFYLDQDIV